MQINGTLRGPDTARVGGYRLVLAFFARLDNSDAGVATEVETFPDATGAFHFDAPDPAGGEVTLRVFRPSGLLALERPLAPPELQGTPVELTVTDDGATALPTGPAPDPVPTKLAGRVIDATGKNEIADAQVVLWGTSGEGAARPIAITRTDPHGYFFAPRTDESFTSVYGTVAVAPEEQVPVPLLEGHLPDKVVLIVHPTALPEAKPDDCACGTPDVPRVPDNTALTSAPETYSTDLGGGRCVDFTTPNRALEEFSYYQVVRTTQPAILGKTIRSKPTIDSSRLASILGGVNTNANTQVNGAALEPISEIDAGLALHLASNPSRFSGFTLASAVRSTAFDRLADEITAITSNHPRKAVTAANPIDWESDARPNQATTIAHGHLLHFKQVWVADGYSMGDLLYSLPLAPCEAKQVAVVDWERREAAMRSESVTSADALTASIARDRDISEIISSVLTENLRGGSSASNWGVGGGLGGAASYMGMGAVLGVSAAGGGASSDAWQDASRTLSASALQQLRDRTMQSASDLRTSRRTVVTSLSQGETSRAETSSVRNHNHCHALTIQYFEVLRHLQVVQYLSDVQECLLVPLLMSPFEPVKALRWREPLTAALRQPALEPAFDALERITSAYDGIDWPSGRFADESVEHASGRLTVAFTIRRPQDNEKGEYDEAAWAFLPKLLGAAHISMGGLDPTKPLQIAGRLFHAGADLLSNPLNVVGALEDLFGGDDGNSGPPPLTEEQKDDLFRRQIAPLLAAAYAKALTFAVRRTDGSMVSLDLEATLIDDYAPGAALRVSLNLHDKPDLRRSDIDAIIVTGPADALPASSSALLQHVSLSYRTAHLQHTLAEEELDEDIVSHSPLIDTPLDDAEKRDPRREDLQFANRLLSHLNDHLEYYHREIWIRMDEARRYMLLDGVAAPEPNPEGRSVASVTENRIIGIVGNCLVLPVAPGYHLDPTYTGENGTIERLRALYAPTTPIPPMRISVPTRGVFAEAVMGACNSCEKKDDSRFWRFEESPCTDMPTPIQPVSTDSRRADPGDLTAKDAPAPIIAMQTAAPAPDPTGLAAALQTLGALGAFRDVNGQANTQKAALSSMQAALSAAQQFGSQAAAVATLGKVGSQAQVSANSDRIMQTIDGAQATGSLTPQQASGLKQQAIRQMIGSSDRPIASDLDVIRQAKESGLITDAQASSLTHGALAKLAGLSDEAVQSPGLRDLIDSAVGSPDSSVSYTRNGDSESLDVTKTGGTDSSLFKLPPEGPLADPKFATVGIDSGFAITTDALAAKIAATTAPDAVEGLTKKVEFVGRYILHPGGLTKDEVDRIHKAGLKIFTIFEWSSNVGTLNAASGTLHAKQAIAEAKALGQPSDAPIYFAVDNSVSGDQWANVIEYFKAIRDEFKAEDSPFPIGIYGADYVLQRIYAYPAVYGGSALCTHFFQTCTGNNVGRWAAANIRQYCGTYNIDGYPVDYDVAPFGGPGSW